MKHIGIYTVYIDTYNTVDLLYSFYTLSDAQAFMHYWANKLTFGGGDVLFEEDDHMAVINYVGKRADIYIQQNSLSTMDFLSKQGWLY